MLLLLRGFIGNSPVFSIRAGASCHLRAAKRRSERKKTVRTAPKLPPHGGTFSRG